MTLDSLKHSAILSTLFKMADDNELIGASEFIKGKKEVNLCYFQRKHYTLYLVRSLGDPGWWLAS